MSTEAAAKETRAPSNAFDIIIWCFLNHLFLNTFTCGINTGLPLYLHLSSAGVVSAYVTCSSSSSSRSSKSSSKSSSYSSRKSSSYSSNSKAVTEAAVIAAADTPLSTAAAKSKRSS